MPTLRTFLRGTAHTCQAFYFAKTYRPPDPVAVCWVSPVVQRTPESKKPLWLLALCLAAFRSLLTRELRPKGSMFVKTAKLDKQMINKYLTKVYTFA